MLLLSWSIQLWPILKWGKRSRRRPTAVGGTPTAPDRAIGATEAPVCLPYASPCAPLLIPWLGNMEGTQWTDNPSDPCSGYVGTSQVLQFGYLGAVGRRCCRRCGQRLSDSRIRAPEHSEVWAVTGEALALATASDVPVTSSSHGINSGAHGEAYSKHTSAFDDQRPSATDTAACPGGRRTWRRRRAPGHPERGFKG